MTTQVLPPAFDAERADAFAEGMVGLLNASGLALMASIGHRTGLFDVLANLPPASSAHIAAAAGLQERYVREWLNAMTVGRIVTYDADGQTYYLPPEHAACLTRAAGGDNIATLCQHIAGLGAVEDKIVDCFYAGGGVPYSGFTRFHTVMAEDSGQTAVASLDEEILPLVPGLVKRLAAGIDVLDVGCGQGRALEHLARRFPASRFRGYDLAADAIATATATAPPNLSFQVKDAAHIDDVERFDLITTFDAIHDQAHPDRVLSHIHRALRPGGVYLMQEIRASSQVQHNLEHPFGPFFYTISCMHCMTVSLAAGGMGLGAMWGRETAMAMLQAAGFDAIERHELPHDIGNDYYVIRKGAA